MNDTYEEMTIEYNRLLIETHEGQAQENQVVDIWLEAVVRRGEDAPGDILDMPEYADVVKARRKSDRRDAVMSLLMERICEACH